MDVFENPLQVSEWGTETHLVPTLPHVRFDTPDLCIKSGIFPDMD
jgi:hypothetical protein